MKDLTPDHLKCIIGSCPSVHEITPSDLQCGGSNSSCPGVHAIANSGDIIVVGKRLPPELQAQMAGKVGDDEHAVVISRAYFANLNMHVGTTTAPGPYEPFDPAQRGPDVINVA